MANDRWKVRKKDRKEVYGPVDTEIIKKWIKERRISVKDYLSNEDEEEWIEAKSIPQFQSLFVPAAKAIYCFDCGNILPQKANFCVKCGIDLKTEKKVTEKKEGKKIAKIVWGLVIALAIGLGIAIYTESRPEVPPEEAVQPELERVEEVIEKDEK